MNHVHLIAVCGTGMSALAGMFKEKGFRVTGSDQNVYPPISDILNEQGIEIRVGYKPENLADKPGLVIVGNAVSRNNPEIEALLQSKIPYLSMPQALKEFFLKGKKKIVVAGTHGKTTTSSIAAWVLEACGKDPGFLIGGIPNNFERNYKLGKGEFFVIEGDEYDTAFFDKGPKFLHYEPDVAIITSIEFDHADIFKDFSHVEEAFKKFIKMIPAEGKLIACAEDRNVMKLFGDASCLKETYGINSEAHWKIKSIKANREQAFTISRNGGILGKGTTSLLGRHNLLNLLGVFAALMSLDLSMENIIFGLKTFKGIRRRQEVVGEENGITIIDDFAHHPTAVRETIGAFRESYPQRRIWAVFEPRSNSSRRNIFEKEYSEAFLEADKIIIAGVYKPDLLDNEIRFSPQRVVDMLRKKDKEAFCIEKVDDIINHLIKNLKKDDIVLIMSNGGFGGIHRKLLEALKAI